jgi:hypothetical protein
VSDSEFTPEQEQFITEVVNRVVRRQARILERIGTDLHALVMTLAAKRLITLEELEASRRQLDAAFEITRARQLYSLIADIDRLDDDFGPDIGDRRSA